MRILLVSDLHYSLPQFDWVVRAAPTFDLVVLLSTPRDVLVERLRTRTSNPFGKRPADLERILADLDAVERRLRAVCDIELVTEVPAEQTLATLLALLSGGRA